ncbi:LLM class flavin-dependent oxidoreductase [Stutzerimonas kirkiae]|uniref:LLM class flavin-dependent oxidoreductase n=1 Tax=Stutzerimonas kirkiae TaxID=2211392 RepID=UPI0010383541|nr:LLM class flavin-dependent oxidoreductase [Stutzerimonas kirkiae]TBV10878.1 nitrilotriacetate monooxygenase [Stutzerimonas kirkiae]
MSRRPGKLRLGLSLQHAGYHAAAWRLPEVPRHANLDWQYYLRSAQAAERGKFDMIFFADGVAVRENLDDREVLARTPSVVNLEPLTLLSALATHTRHIGLVGTASTTYNEPYHIARKFASLDHISGGRAAWNLVTSWSLGEARNFGRDTPLDYDSRYARAREFARVVHGLWNSWEDDTFVEDKQSGLFFDPDKLHVLGHQGEHFSVQGPLNLSRTPQGRPLICQAGKSPAGQEIAAESADFVFTADHSIEDGQAYYREVKGRLAQHGRRPGQLLILPGVVPIVGRSEQEAQDKFGRLQALIDPKIGLSLLALLGDLSAYPLDGPLPPIHDYGEMASVARLIEQRARKDNLSIRQLYQAIAASRGHRTLVGSAEQVADDLQAWFEAEAADGFNIAAPYLPGAVDDFVDLVIPELQRRELFRREYEGTTLRQNLGLDYPEHPRSTPTHADH